MERTSTACGTAVGPRYTTPSRSQTTASYRETSDEPPLTPVNPPARMPWAARRRHHFLVTEVGDEDAVELLEALHGIGLGVDIALRGLEEPGPRLLLAAEAEQRVGVGVVQAVGAGAGVAAQCRHLEGEQGRLVLTEVPAHPGHHDGQLDPVLLRQGRHLGRRGEVEGAAVATQPALAVDHERQQVGGATEASDRPELGQGAREVTAPIGHHPQRLPGSRDPPGPPHRRLGVREGRVEVICLELGSHHDEVLGDTLRVLLRQGAQLVVDGPVELLAGHAFRDAGFGQSGSLRGEPAAAPLLPGLVAGRFAVPAAGRAAGPGTGARRRAIRPRWPPAAGTTGRASTLTGWARESATVTPRLVALLGHASAASRSAAPTAAACRCEGGLGGAPWWRRPPSDSVGPQE